MKLIALLVGLVFGVAMAACSTAAPGGATATSSEDEIAETLADDRPSVLVKDPRTLVKLEEAGLSFSKVVGADSAVWTTITRTLIEDLTLMKRQDPKAGVGVDFPHRLFDAKWLTLDETRFELVGVVNRMDRAHAWKSGCGEFRLVYRLAYDKSRLPMTVNVVFPQDGACRDVANRWLDESVETHLAKLPAIASVEVNLQSARWPSNERPEFGGHAEYILRVFAIDGGTVTTAPLENTPRSNLDDAERAELAAWVKENLAALDQGTAIVPAKFLASKAISIGPAGIARDANRPWTRLFPDAQQAFGDLAFDQTEQLPSPAALLRRLDTMTCNGCHQARSIAGFHLLGEDRNEDARMNALAIGRSSHFEGELEWRAASLTAIAAGKAITARPFAERPTTSGGYGTHCGLGDKGFAKWTCDAGLECLDVHQDVVGVCSPSNAPVGDACEVGTVTKSPNPRLDSVSDIRQLACNDGRGARCNPTSQGFPDGMCRLDCSPEAMGTVVEDTICGEIPSASGLTACLAEKKPFDECVAKTSSPTFLRTCDRTNACRDDYACTRVRNGPPGVGACMPPYFAFQARVDGHLL